MDTERQSPARSRNERRSVDLQIIADWIEPGSNVLDLGCGRGILLEYLIRKKKVFGVGVDIDSSKVLSCVRRQVPVYQGDLLDFMKTFPDQFFGHVICSRTLQELPNPSATLMEALRLSRNVTVGFVNYAFWKNRFSLLASGSRIRNEVYPTDWHESRAIHPVSIADFERFCREQDIEISRRVYLGGDWKRECRFQPNLLAGYAIYDLRTKAGASRDG